MKWVQRKSSEFTLGTIWKHHAETRGLGCCLPASIVKISRLLLSCVCLGLLIIAWCCRITGFMIWSIFPISESKDQFCKHKKISKLHPTLTAFPAFKVGCPQSLLICLSAFLGVFWLSHSCLGSAAGTMKTIQHLAWVCQAESGRIDFTSWHETWCNYMSLMVQTNGLGLMVSLEGNK